LGWEQPELEQKIVHYRLADRFAKRSRLDTRRRCQILTNLGNSLSQYGRIVEAIAIWDQALELIPDFGMARGNRARELTWYAGLIHDSGHKALLLSEAHDELTRTLDLPLDGQTRAAFRSTLGEIKSQVPERWLKGKATSIEASLGRSKAERLYRKWCLRHRLFLNDLNDLGPVPIAAADVLSLPGIVLPIRRPPHFHVFFNQLKQEYVSARYLYYEGIGSRRSHFSDRWVALTNTLDYPVHSLSAEKVKLSFRSVYSLLDKIAYFLNRYLKIGLSDTSVTFRTIWYRGTGKSKRLRSEIHKPLNYPLRALFSMSKDIHERSAGFADDTEPQANVVANMRNHLEHKYLMIREMAGDDFVAADVEESSASASEDAVGMAASRAEFESRTLWLLRTVRAALIYLPMAVHVEEHEGRRARPKNERVGTIELVCLEDRWKT